MSLTYQPFAEMPAVEQLSEDLKMNVPDDERVISGVLGAGLVAAGFARRGLSRWMLLLAGGALIRRGFSGHCTVYERLGKDQRHGTKLLEKPSA